jgi:hypothetical protein
MSYTRKDGVNVISFASLGTKLGRVVFHIVIVNSKIGVLMTIYSLFAETMRAFEQKSNKPHRCV